MSQFIFDPPNGSCVQAELDENSTALNHFFSIYDDDTVDQLITNINSYATHKVALNLFLGALSTTDGTMSPDLSCYFSSPLSFPWDYSLK